MKLSTIAMTFALALACSVETSAQTSVYDLNKPVGFGKNITGSSDKNPVRVTTLDELKNALKKNDSSQKTVYIEGTIEVDQQVTFDGLKNKTIYGLPGSKLVNPSDPKKTKRSGIMALKNCDNVILRNLTFEGAGAYDMDGDDNFYLQKSTNIWVDHCDFQDGTDGNFDCSKASDNVCVTWARFHYLKKPIAGGSGGSDDHRYSDLWGGSDSETESKGKLNTTFMACWWDAGCRERMPRVRFGKVHLLNCLYSCKGNNKCVDAGYLSNIYLDRCAFIDVKKPWVNDGAKSKKVYNITVTGCIGTNDTQSRGGSEDYFKPADYYTLDGFDVDLVQNEVSQYAGATLNVVYGQGNTTGIGIADNHASAYTVDTEYFSPSGTKLAHPQKGMNIIRHRMSDGTVRTTKVMVR